MSKREQSQSIDALKRKGRKIILLEKTTFVLEDIYEKCTSSKLSTKLNTGLIYDDRYTLHKCEWDPEYPENPKRYTCIIDRFIEYGLIDRCDRISRRNATREEICTLHEESTIDLLESTKVFTDLSKLETLASNYDAVYFNEHTSMAAHLAAGSVTELVRAVVENEVQNGMAVVRPPGHHAMRDQYCGYCYFNNVALAAQYALDKLNLTKILIVDWDVHHGQGTQQMFYDDPRVLYFSIHRYEQGTFWPNLRESDFDNVGSKAGYGYNINIPLNETKCSDADYLTIFHSVLLPVAYEFSPDLVLISSGYDAAIGCFEGQMLVSPGCYHHLTTSLMGLANGKVVAVLEGGYFLPSLAEGAAQTLRALLGDPAPILDPLVKPAQSVLTTIYNSISLLRTKWKCFNYISKKNTFKDDPRPEHTVKIIYNGEESKPPFETRDCYPKHTPEESKHFEEEIARLRHNFYEGHPKSKIGYVYDAVMELHESPNFGCYENPERLTRTLKIFSELNLLHRLQKEQSRPATLVELSTVHSENYIAKISQMAPHTESELTSKEGWTTVYTNKHTMESSQMAVGSLIELVQSVLDARVTAGIGVIRPPGHHADPNAPSGFCIFNNVAVAARYALNKGLKRVMILDWDVHHGNGIQRIFYDDPRVLYMSLHRYDDAKFFPYSRDADYTQMGEDNGKGYNVNIPWNNFLMGDAEYISAFTRIVLPIAYEFNPELLLISAGFDACKGDQLGSYSVSPEAYGHFVQLLKPLAGGRVVLALEGGYNINSVGYSLAMCCKALLNDPLPALAQCGQVCESAVRSLNDAVRVHEDKWKMLLKDVRYEEDEKV